MFVLVDTNIWIDHYREKNPILQRLLYDRMVLIHPLIIEEFALGLFRHRDLLLEHMGNLPQVKQARHAEILHFINEYNLMGRGIGALDTALVCSAILTPKTYLWTKDRRLSSVAKVCDVLFSPAD